jgi:hypothetical protein
LRFDAGDLGQRCPRSRQTDNVPRRVDQDDNRVSRVSVCRPNSEIGLEVHQNPFGRIPPAGASIILQIISVTFLLIVLVFTTVVVTFRTRGFDCAGQEPLFFHICDILTKNRDTMACATVRARHLHSPAHNVFDWFYYISEN